MIFQEKRSTFKNAEHGYWYIKIMIHDYIYNMNRWTCNMEKEVQPRSMYPLNIHAHAVYIVNFVIWIPYIYMYIYIVHPGRLAAGTWKWWFGRWFSFSRGPVFSGSMLILRGVYSKAPLVELFTKHTRQGTEWQPCETWQAARRRDLCLQ